MIHAEINIETYVPTKLDSDPAPPLILFGFCVFFNKMNIWTLGKFKKKNTIATPMLPTSLRNSL